MALLVADLHLHSDASDGELPPEAVVDLAAETGLRAIALTDHDTVAGLPRALERARLRGVEVIPGCELTAYEGSVELHLLAYGFEFEDEASPLGRLLSAQREARHARAFEIAARLRGHGVAVPDEAVLAAAGPAAALGRPHVARALVAGGHARDMQDAFQRYLGRHAPGHVEKPRVAPKTVIDAVHASGGSSPSRIPRRTTN
ncbi:MAG: PHP domain-containing protein [Planctomycetota bacterium]|nr:PHP domain-containing protein [Planctomycetota bacterium]